MENDLRNFYPFKEEPFAKELRGWLTKPVLKNTKQFQVNVDVQQFKPEELSVKLLGNNTVVIEGKHEEMQDDHGFISRHFVRKYLVPDGYDIKKMQSKLSFDGVLTITAPKKLDEKHLTYVNIPVMRTNECVNNGKGDD
ncbi:hypothetical protein D910_05927 [Dendroctonus ponderosae]|uniref:SHSP domain-containing protein n=2 Tax=Dendroctonus ponderosae TaxID=77166 RepID=U4U639_DENPD|nr:hypothetical protein D910_05927 [Dendroctonus ponderosae]KAH1011317.1 hypothetical protein HUJ04_000718 [Dendroctonus ponderosae]KAH1018783.1 hypothetical protein HUJ05_006484 [Dendroctonus ponderosae]